MSKSPIFRFDWTQTVTVPIRRVGDRWECFYGGDVPVEEGALGELTIRTAQITDEQFVGRMTQTAEVKILEEGTPLMVALGDRSTGPKAQWPDVAWQDVPPGTTRFERIVIGPPRSNAVKAKAGPLFIGPPQRKEGGLWLRLKGMERSELTCSTVLMPDGFEPRTALSLNHAFTLLSKAYETHRISNTGSVYRQLFYRETDQCWHPLADLRAGVQAQREQTLINTAWKQIEETIGWRPVIAGGQRRKR